MNYKLQIMNLNGKYMMINNAVENCPGCNFDDLKVFTVTKNTDSTNTVNDATVETQCVASLHNLSPDRGNGKICVKTSYPNRGNGKTAIKTVSPSWGINKMEVKTASPNRGINKIEIKTNSPSWGNGKTDVKTSSPFRDQNLQNFRIYRILNLFSYSVIQLFNYSVIQN